MDYSPFDKSLMITGSADKSIGVWDTRNMKTKLFSLRQHRDEVNQVKFSRQSCNLLASSGYDRRIMVWDLSRCGRSQSMEEKLDGLLRHTVLACVDLAFPHCRVDAKQRHVSFTLASLKNIN